MKPVLVAFWFLFTAGQVAAQDARDVVDRLLALRQADPELFGFISSMTRRASPRAQVLGGFSFEVTNVHLRCDEFIDAGFDDCTVDLDIEAESFAESPDNRHVSLDIECDVSLGTARASGFGDSLSQRDDINFTFYGGGTDRDSLSVRFDTYWPSDPVVSAEVGAVDCEISDIR